jgi:hypothetical protein
MVTSIGKLISQITKRDEEDKMKVKMVDDCPLSSSSWICHPSCNWRNGTDCNYPKQRQLTTSRHAKQ